MRDVLLTYFTVSQSSLSVCGSRQTGRVKLLLSARSTVITNSILRVVAKCGNASTTTVSSFLLLPALLMADEISRL